MKLIQLYIPSTTICVIWILWSVSHSVLARDTLNGFIAVSPIQVPGNRMQQVIELSHYYPLAHSGRLTSAGHKVAKGVHHVGSKIKDKVARRRRQRHGEGFEGQSIQYLDRNQIPYSVNLQQYKSCTHTNYGEAGHETHWQNEKDFNHLTNYHNSFDLLQQATSSSLINELQMKVEMMRHQLDSMGELLGTLASKLYSSTSYNGNYQSADHPIPVLSVSKSSSGVSSNGADQWIQKVSEVEPAQKNTKQLEGAESDDTLGISKLKTVKQPTPSTTQQPISANDEQVINVPETNVPQVRTPNMSSGNHQGNMAPTQRHLNHDKIDDIAQENSVKKLESFSTERPPLREEGQSVSIDGGLQQFTPPISHPPLAVMSYQQPESYQRDGGKRGRRRDRASRKMRKVANKIKSYTSGSGNSISNQPAFQLQRAVPDMLGTYPVIPQV